MDEISSEYERIAEEMAKAMERCILRLAQEHCVLMTPVVDSVVRSTLGSALRYYYGARLELNREAQAEAQAKRDIDEFKRTRFFVNDCSSRHPGIPSEPQ